MVAALCMYNHNFFLGELYEMYSIYHIQQLYYSKISEYIKKSKLILCFCSYNDKVTSV